MEFYSWLGGVDPVYRGLGIASQLMTTQHSWSRKKGYAKVQTKTQNRFRSMLILNLNHGFEVIGTHTSDEGALRSFWRRSSLENSRVHEMDDIGALGVGMHLFLSHFLLPHLHLREIHPFSTWRIYSLSYPDKVDISSKPIIARTNAQSNSIKICFRNERRSSTLYWQLQTWEPRLRPIRRMGREWPETPDRKHTFPTPGLLLSPSKKKARSSNLLFSRHARISPRSEGSEVAL